MIKLKPSKKDIWKRRIRWVTSHVVMPTLRFALAAVKWVWRCIKGMWKQRGKRNPQQPLMIPASYVMCIGVVLVVASTLASLISGGKGAAATVTSTCVLREGVSSTRIQRYWPAVRQWCPQIMEAGEDYQLDPHLIAAVMWVESVGNPVAYSHSGAVGLMQVMPRDGLAADFMCPNGPCFADRPSIAELQDPVFNVDYGARLLAGNIARLGSWRDGLRAYGPRDAGYSYADKVLGIYEQIRQ